jgi:hypothetical protein
LVGDHYESGDKTVTGDIVLNNAALYVEGDLTVLGSIRGAGAVYVGGDTTFSGDSVVASNEDGVVLYSQGNVHLRGFDGTEWMDQVTAAEGLSLEWQQTKSAFRTLRQYLLEYAANPSLSGSPHPAFIPPPDTPDDLNAARAYYWRSEAGLLLAHLNDDVSFFHPPGITESDLLRKMVDAIESRPTGSPGDPTTRTREFMLSKFRGLYNPDPDLASNEVFTNALGGPHPGGADQSLIQDFTTGDREGLVPHRGLSVELVTAAAMIDGQNMGPPYYTSYSGLSEQVLAEALVKHAHWFDLYDFDHLGRSYFQGNIYTRGAIYASNEVTIVGSLSAVDDPDEADTPWDPPHRDPDDSDVSLKPGDVHLGNGTRILHVADLEPGTKGANPPVGVVYWLR